LKEIWRLQQLPIEDLELLQGLKFGSKEKRSRILHRIAGNSVPESMARHMAELTRQWILQLCTGAKETTKASVNITHKLDDNDHHEKEGEEDPDWDSDVEESECDSDTKVEPNETVDTMVGQVSGQSDNHDSHQRLDRQIFDQTDTSTVQYSEEDTGISDTQGSTLSPIREDEEN
jgi:hypothetical protein